MSRSRGLKVSHVKANIGEQPSETCVLSQTNHKIRVKIIKREGERKAGGGRTLRERERGEER